MTRGGAVRRFFPPLFFLAWAVAFTYPLVFRISDAVILRQGSDAWLHLWDLWWADKSLVELSQNPYYTSYLYHPSGLNLFYHSLDIINGLISIPLQHLFGLTSTFNLLLLGNLTLDGLAAYWLCLDRTGSMRASIVAGSLFASTPLLGTSVDRGQLDEVTAYWLPLYVLALWRAIYSPGPVWRRGGGRRAALCAGLCLAGASLATWYFTAGLVIFTALFVPVHLLCTRPGTSGPPEWKRWWEPAIKAAAPGALFVLLLSPLLWAMVRERLSGATYMLPSFSTTVYNSADLVAPFLPARLDLPDINRHGNDIALGYVALALGVLGTLRGGRKVLPIALALVALLVMSMGPKLLVAGSETSIPLPYALLNNVPFIGASRQPLRFLATAGLCLALLAGYGMIYLSMLLETSLWKRALVPVLLALVALELFALPRQLVSTGFEPAYLVIKQSSETGAVMELPAEEWKAEELWGQTLHERPVVGGYTSRHFPYPITELPVPGVYQLYNGKRVERLVEPDILSPAVSRTARMSLDFYDIRFVVVHKQTMRLAGFAQLQMAIDAIFTQKDVIYDDKDVIVYLTPHTPRDLPLAGLADGWYEIEQSDTGVSRWTNGSAGVWLSVPPRAAGRYKLRLIANAYGSPRQLRVSLDGSPASTAQVGTSPETVVMDLPALTPGEHLLTLAGKEPPAVPPGDGRYLSIAFSQVAIEKSSP